MGAAKAPGRNIYNDELAKLGRLPQFYTTIVRMKRPDFSAERIRRARSGKAVDFEVLEILQKVASDYARTLEPQPVAA